MTVYQSSANAYMAFKKQSALGSQASGSGGTLLRQTGGAGGAMTRAATASNEVRRDGMSTRGRLGIQKTTGQWTSELSLGSFEAICEAIMRDTWDVAPLVLTEADFTSLVVGAHTLTAGGGDFRTLGLRKGDVIIPTLLADAANNSRNLRITGLTDVVITVAETLTPNATPDTACTLTRPKKLIQYAGGALIKRYFTIDEYDVDIDQSEVMTDFMWGSMKFSMAPNGIIMCDVGGVGTGQLDPLATGSSPLLTSPSESVAEPLSVVDATIRVNGVDVVDLTSFDISCDIKPSSPDVFGSSAVKYGPDVFAGDMEISMNISALRKDLQFVQDFAAETVYELHVLAAENAAEPKGFASIYLGNFTIGGVQKSALAKSGKERTQTISIPSALIGKDQAGVGHDATMIKFQSTGI